MKIYLLYNNQRISKKKTHVKKRTLNPVFNESFVFDLPRSEAGLAKVQLEFMLLDWDRVTKNEVELELVETVLPVVQVIGRLELGGEACQGPELAHWKEIQVTNGTMSGKAEGVSW